MWKKSSFSFSNGNCVEADVTKRLVRVRDSKSPATVLSFSPAAWQAFLVSMGRKLTEQ